MQLQLLRLSQDDFHQPSIANGYWQLAWCTAFRKCTRFLQARHLNFPELLQLRLPGVSQKAKAFAPAAEPDRVCNLIEAEDADELEQMDDEFADDQFLEQYRRGVLAH